MLSCKYIFWWYSAALVWEHDIYKPNSSWQQLHTAHSNPSLLPCVVPLLTSAAHTSAPSIPPFLSALSRLSSSVPPPFLTLLFLSVYPLRCLLIASLLLPLLLLLFILTSAYFCLFLFFLFLKSLRFRLLGIFFCYPVLSVFFFPYG